MSKSYRTSINLDEYTSEIVKKIPNRSEFMRECIRRWYAAQMDKEHIHMTEIEVCWPYSQLGVCSICWPRWDTVQRGLEILPSLCQRERKNRVDRDLEGSQDRTG